MKRKKKIILGVLLAVVLAILMAAVIYISGGYKADTLSVEAFKEELSVDCYEGEKGTLIFEPQDTVSGFIFYPGGKVDHKAYEPLMSACASEGILCILVEMPFDLAVLDSDRAQGIKDKFPEIENWYIGGHSLGGAMAASYISGTEEDFKGLVLLGAYSTEDLTDTGYKVLSIYGSEDKVLNMEKYEEYKGNLPEDYKELVIQGGCHAYFGMYGEQEGDGTATITCEEQITITAGSIADFISAY